MDLLVCVRVTAVSREGDGGGGDVQGEIGEQPGGETPWTHPWGVGCGVCGGSVFLSPKRPREGGFRLVLELMDEREPPGRRAGLRHRDRWQGDGDTGTGRRVTNAGIGELWLLSASLPRVMSAADPPVSHPCFPAPKPKVPREALRGKAGDAPSSF